MMTSCPMGGGGVAGAGGCGGRLGDIIDLDRYMRAAVRRSVSNTTDDGRNDRLVVDGGGVKGSPGAGAGAGVGAGALSSSSAESAARAHHKRYSHDSGLSDGSYAPRTRRPHRRSSAAEGGGRFRREPDHERERERESRDSRAARAAAGSSDSLREFRAVCERALLNQQQQLARVTQLCERLTAPPPSSQQPLRTAPDSSELSSSSCSTKDQRRKDKHRANECKTYKIIMNKLDELNRLFAARGRSAPIGQSHPSPPAAAPRHRSPSCSVSVSDKFVATEPQKTFNNIKLTSQNIQGKQMERAAGEFPRQCSRECSCECSCKCSCPGSRSRRVVRAVTHACALDIAPADCSARSGRPNVTTESIIERVSRCVAGVTGEGGEGGEAGEGGEEGEEWGWSACDPRCGFDLDDPMHLYAQAKRLQALHASTRRSKSAGCGGSVSHGSRLERRLGERFVERLDKRGAGRSARESSLCALCRGYWRAVRRYIGAQLT